MYTPTFPDDGVGLQQMSDGRFKPLCEVTCLTGYHDRTNESLGLLAYWLIGLIGLLAYWLIGLMGLWAYGLIGLIGLTAAG